MAVVLKPVANHHETLVPNGGGGAIGINSFDHDRYNSTVQKLKKAKKTKRVVFSASNDLRRLVS